MPFDPSEVIDNLRLERYAADSTGTDGFSPRSWQSTAYYGLREFIPVGVRRALQRAYLRDWKTRPFPRWPVDATVERILERLLLLSLRSQGISRLPFVWFWPEGAPSSVILTHDVETAAGLEACEWLMDTDEARGIRASFQLVPEGRYGILPAFLDEIRRRGFEVNVHDLNHDGRLVLVTANFPLTVSVLMSSSPGSFAPAQTLEAGRGNGHVEVGDLDRDGELDLIILGEHSNTVSVLLGNGDGTFQPKQDFTSDSYPDVAVVADFDGDRRLDLAAANINGDSISVYLNRSSEARTSWLRRLTRLGFLLFY